MCMCLVTQSQAVPVTVPSPGRPWGLSRGPLRKSPFDPRTPAWLRIHATPKLWASRPAQQGPGGVQFGEGDRKWGRAPECV